MMLKKIVSLVIPLLAFPLAVNAATVQLPQTGQSSCYSPSGEVIACAGTGQDGERQTGVAWPAPRFTDPGDGTVTDNLTGLVWLKNASCFDAQTWDAARAQARTLQSGQCGLTDNSVAGAWRMPNIRELQSLFDLSRAEIAFASLPAGHPFTDVESSYWSSTTHARFTTSAWLNRLDGGVLSDAKTNNTYFLWPVRNGQ